MEDTRFSLDLPRVEGEPLNIVAISKYPDQFVLCVAGGWDDTGCVGLTRKQTEDLAAMITLALES